MGVQAAQEDVGEDTVMPGMWLEESAYGHTGSDIESFIHDDGDDDGHDPAKLMLLVERMLRQPPAPRRQALRVHPVRKGSDRRRSGTHGQEADSRKPRLYADKHRHHRIVAPIPDHSRRNPPRPRCGAMRSFRSGPRIPEGG